MALLTDSWKVDVLAMLAIVWTLLYFYLRQLFTYWERRGFKAVPDVSYIFGHFQNSVFRREYIGTLFEKLYRSTTEPFIGVYGLFQPLLLIRDPELIHSIMTKDFSHFTDRLALSDYDHDAFSASLITFPGDKWAPLRRKISPAFTSSKLKSVFSTFVARAPILHKYLDDLADKGELLDIYEVFERHSTNVTAKILFGIDVDTLNDPNSYFRESTKRALNPSGLTALRMIISFLSPNIMRILRLKLFGEEYEKFFTSIFNDVLQNDDNSNAPKTYLQIMLKMRNGNHVQHHDETETKDDGDEHRLTMQEILVQSNIIFGGTIESPSMALTLLMFEITRNPEIQERLINEIDAVLMKHDGQITYESVTEMEYTQSIVDEILRKYPFAPMLTRVCVEDYQIPESDKVIKKGETLLFSIYGLHRDERFYPDPLKFDPERFNKDNLNGSNQINQPYYPYGDGPRYCVGRQLANLLIKVGLILLFQKFKFELEDNLKSLRSIELAPRSLWPFPVQRIRLHVSKR